MIVVWFSCGAASAVAAKCTLLLYGGEDVRVVNNPVFEEDIDNERFMHDVEEWLGVEIERYTNTKFPSASAVDVWGKRRFMSGPTGAPCTVELKKRARQEWQERNKPDWHVLGFTADEKVRHDRFVTSEIDNVIPVLIDMGLNKQDCVTFLEKEGLILPDVYRRGYPNANCIGCVKATSPTYWNHVRRDSPEVFEDRARQSREIGAKLVRYKGERIFLDELPADAKGAPLKSLTLECGVFCEES